MTAAETSEHVAYRLFPSVRLFMIFLTFCGFASLWCGFASFNFAIVCMVNSTSADGSSNNSSTAFDPTCSDTSGNVSQPMSNAYGGEFAWDKPTQGNLLAAYSWGAIWMSIPSGWLSDRYGSKYVFSACIFTNFVAMALMPWAAFKGEYWVFAARLFSGMAGGAGFPCIISTVTRWGTSKERGTFLSLVNIGNTIGQLLTVSTSGVLCQSSLKWPSIFYIWAGFGAFALLLWAVFYKDNPDKCHFISMAEKQFLAGTENASSTQKRKTPAVPWKYVFLAPAAWSIYVSHFCNVYLFVLINMFVPVYSKEILRLDLTNNGIFSALPMLVQLVPCLFCGIMADKLVCKSRSMTFSVKVFNTLSFGVPCIGLLTLTYLDCHNSIALPIFCLCLCTFFYITCIASFIRSMVLIAPQFSGTISAVSNICCYIAAIAVPYVVSVMNQHGTADEWHKVFYMCLGVSLLGCVVFLIFGSGEEQKWSMNIRDNAPGAVTTTSDSQIETKLEDTFCTVKMKF